MKVKKRDRRIAFYCLGISLVTALGSGRSEALTYESFCRWIVSSPKDKSWVEDRISRARRYWAKEVFTDPKNHDPNDYLYVARAIYSTKIERAIRDLEDPRFLPNDYVSASVMGSEGKTGAFGNFHGVLLSSPPENVIASANRDLGLTNNWTPPFQGPDFMRTKLFEDGGSQTDYEWILYNEFGVTSPKQMLRGGDTRWNEVALAKQSPYGTLKVVGIFYCDEGILKTKPKDLAILKNIAGKLGLPLVALRCKLRL